MREADVPRSASRLAPPFRRFLGDRLGAAATEFAVIAPLALALMSLAVAGGQSLTLFHKVVISAHGVTDLVSRTPYQPDPNNNNAELLAQSDLDTDLAMSAMILYPNDTTNLTVVLSELQVNQSTNQGTVVWSEGYNGGTALATGAIINLDPSYSNAGATYLLYGQVSYTFQPLGGILALPAITLNSTETLTIRNAQQITVQWGS